MDRGWRPVLVLMIAMFAASATAHAQTVRTGSISGSITDESSAALPGATVTLTSPALQQPQLTRISEISGQSQFSDLPPGEYNLKYELGGFSTLLRENIRLTTGFAARVDVVLKLAQVEETVVVTGQGPLVDVVNTRGGGTVTKEALEQLPTNKNYYDTMLLGTGRARSPGRRRWARSDSEPSSGGTRRTASAATPATQSRASRCCPTRHPISGTSTKST